MKTFSNILNLIVCLLLLAFGVIVFVACGYNVKGMMVLALMSASAVCHFLSKRIRFMLIFEGLTVLGIILSVMVMI